MTTRVAAPETSESASGAAQSCPRGPAVLAAGSATSAGPHPDVQPPRRTGRRIVVLLAAVVLLALISVLSLAVGARGIAPGEVLSILLDPAGARAEDASGNAAVVLSRVPRLVMGLGVGAALGLAGALMQGVTRNPLADPGIMGINAGAALAVVFGILFLGLGNAASYIWLSFIGAAVAAVAVYWVAEMSKLSRSGTGASSSAPVRLALAGAAISAGLYSLTNAILVLRQDTLEQFRFWQLGSIAAREFSAVLPAVPFMLIGMVLALMLARPLDMLALGEDTAASLGQKLWLTRGIATLAVVLLAGSATAVAGPIGFLGLVVPHAARLLVGGEHRWLLPLSAVLAPVLLLSADVVGRVILLPSEVPAGILTALVGAPVFVILLLRRKGARA